MSSVDLPQLMDDNLITRRKKIMQSIEDIRGKKAEIAQALRELGVGNPQQNESVKNDMKQLLEAYDAISSQETQYMEILKTIVGIHEQATLDIAQDFERKIEKDAQKLKETKEKQEENAEEQREKTPEELANSETMAELQEALLELKKVSEEAVRASELNEKLVESLQLTKAKKSARKELNARRAKELDETAAVIRADVMEKINKMSALKKTTAKQERELKDLQKQCLQLGLQLGVEDQVDPEAERATLDDNQRVPVIGETQQKPELNEEEKERRREEIRENIKRELEQKEQVNSQIREKLAAMDARRKRLQQIRKMLEKQEENAAASAAQNGEGIPLTPETPRPSVESPDVPEAPIAAPEGEDVEGPVVEKSLDDILLNAKANLSNLTAMRERLEHIKETGGADLNEEDIQLLQRLDTIDLEEEPSVKAPKSEVDLIMSERDVDDVDVEDQKNDIEAAVRSSFHAVFRPKTLILEESQLEMVRKARLAAIEEMVRKIDDKLPSAAASLSLSLLSLRAGELRELAAHLLRLAELQEPVAQA
ncbi:unnamed protein product [Caenorhabditis sp. 36 PRJEB53466]|nr:unnamed protein product [Caenorhabditis sp. 36 PRJEB53466]